MLSRAAVSHTGALAGADRMYDALLTSLGRACLATLAPDAFGAMMTVMSDKHRGRGWPELRREIEAAVRSVREKGYCVASW
ncbi:hypothetical protein [Cupriavidus consociatus]|uniref:hypothetical protein n=1 Tax=Cupriavidus consociatus TaxID=2821357 RepID=UPI001FD787D2|nr:MULTISPECIES: hypothetical protein [unclassified Cupriavidus]MDK2660328.1 hypothetical protein [Cupriavidus sp. LEh21]